MGTFHWHRAFPQGPTGPQRAVKLARKTLQSNGSTILQVCAGIRHHGEKALDGDGQDITERIYADAQVVHAAMVKLLMAGVYMAAHPARFGEPLTGAKEEDRAQKEENQDEEERLSRWRDQGYFVDETSLDAR